LIFTDARSLVPELTDFRTVGNRSPLWSRSKFGFAVAIQPCRLRAIRRSSKEKWANVCTETGECGVSLSKSTLRKEPRKSLRRGCDCFTQARHLTPDFRRGDGPAARLRLRCEPWRGCDALRCA